MSDKYAVRITSPTGHIVLKMERQGSAPQRPRDSGEQPTTKDTLSDIETIMAIIENASRDGTALVSIIEPESPHATAVIPGPGMSFQVMPWADHLEANVRSQAVQMSVRKAEAAQGQLVRPATPGRLRR